MRRIASCVWLASIMLWSAAAFAGEDESPKEESAEAAASVLQKVREKAGDLCRFEAEFYIAKVDHTFGTEERGRGTIYFESPGDALLTIRTIDVSGQRSRHRTSNGAPDYDVRAIRPVTLLWKNGTLTDIDEQGRTYRIDKRRPTGDCFGWWTAALFLATQPRNCVPTWLDPQIEWQDLISRYEFRDAKSTPSVFAFRLVRRKSQANRWGPDWCDGVGFDCDYELLFDRKTNLPLRCTIEGPSVNVERTYVYTRFDVAPPHRELKVNLAGYQDETPPRSTDKSSGQ